MSLDKFHIWYDDGTSLSTAISNWDVSRREGIVCVLLRGPRYNYVMSNYDFYAVWFDTCWNYVVWGPTEVYGKSIHVKLDKFGKMEVSEFLAEDEDLTLPELHKKTGIYVPWEDYELALTKLRLVAKGIV